MTGRSDILRPSRAATESFDDAEKAVARLTEIYERNTEFLRQHFEAYLGGETPAAPVRKLRRDCIGVS